MRNETGRTRASIVLVVAGFLILATAAAALADGIAADADNDALSSPHPTLLATTQAVGTTVTYPFAVTVGNTSPASNDVFRAGLERLRHRRDLARGHLGRLAGRHAEPAHVDPLPHAGTRHRHDHGAAECL